MKLNVTQEIIGLTGEPIKDSKTQKPVLFRTLIANVLMEPVTGTGGEEKIKNFDLAKRIMDEDEVELSVDEAKKVKDLIGQFQSAVVVKRIWDALENSDSREESG